MKVFVEAKVLIGKNYITAYITGFAMYAAGEGIKNGLN